MKKVQVDYPNNSKFGKPRKKKVFYNPMKAVYAKGGGPDWLGYKGAPVLCFKDMSPEKQAEMRRLYEPCYQCHTVEVVRSDCPVCGKIVCIECAEKPYEFCCDDVTR